MEKELIDFEKVEKNLKIKPKNKELWLSALLHKSWLFYHPEFNLPHNERLEFLGDAILQTITSLYLFREFPQLTEGELTLVRAKLVSREKLGEIGKKLKINKFALIGKIEDEKGKKTVLGNILESIIGAIFLDWGWKRAEEFAQKFILKDAKKIVEKKLYKDPKTLLQEIFLQKYQKLPFYKLVAQEGPSHRQKFKIEVYLDEEKIGEGEGWSKQEAEEKAALQILKSLKNKHQT